MNAVAEQRTAAFDPVLLAAIVGLLVIGAIMVGSASISIADRQTGEPLFYLVRHVGAIGIGVLGMLTVMLVPTDTWYRMNWLLLVAAFGLLAVVLIPGVGHAVNGSRRWLLVGPVTLQASEPARLCLLLYIGSYAVRRAQELGASLNGLVKPLLVIGAASTLLLAEPDFGSAVVLGATTLGILFVAGARLRDFLLAVAVGVVLLAILAMSSQYRLARLMVFRDPWADPFAGGFQLTQSLIAIGRGDIGGVGLGESVQKLFYLPEAHTDFVFAVLVEELGFAGASIVIALFAIVVYRAVALGREALASGMHFQGLVATGIGLMLGFEAFINIGVNTGLLPTKGLPLPLLSYGRSSTVVTLIALGLLLRIHRELYGSQKRFVQRGYVR
ncbi:MAG TPA: putative lipid II flippase FtsW [Gammaproteobacteria bacterium]|jgi:cell division protein FtsW|nr:putative lipid II flippase FtsW [Gammaproteobacteria bacterium]